MPTARNDAMALPLRKAYAFGHEKGLTDEIDEIRNLEIDGLPSPPVRRGYIIELFTKHGYFDEFMDLHWANGRTQNGLSRIKRCESYRRKHQEMESEENEKNADAEEAFEQRFAFESHLRDYLAKNLGVLETGLQLYHGDKGPSVEFPVENGRIDVLAVDQNGKHVVVELKLSKGRNKTLGQILYYMGWVDRNFPNPPCRGFIVAAEISEELRTAVKRTPGIELFEYSISMTAKKIEVD